MGNILETKGLNVGYGPIHVIYDLDFEVPEGEVTVIVGPNGVGKTTLLKAIMGLATVYSGQVFFQGKDITRMPPYERTKMGLGYMPQVSNAHERRNQVIINFFLSVYLAPRFLIRFGDAAAKLIRIIARGFRLTSFLILRVFNPL